MPGWPFTRPRARLLFPALFAGAATFAAPATSSAAFEPTTGVTLGAAALGVIGLVAAAIMALALKRRGSNHDSTAKPEGARADADLIFAAAPAAERQDEAAGMGGALDQVDFPVWLRDRTLSLWWCNKAYADSVEESREDVVSGEGIELSAGPVPGEAKALAEKATAAGSPRSERRHVVLGGQRRLLEIVEAPLGNGAGTIGVARDLTDLEQAEADLTRHVSAHAEVLESLSTAIATFGADKRLQFFNS